MSPPRFFVPNFPREPGGQLDAAESKHAMQVLRLKVGQLIEVFDGAGLSAQARIASIDNKHVSFEVLEILSNGPPHGVSLEMAVALPRGDRQKILVDTLCQLGVTRLQPLSCDRSVAEATANAIERLNRQVLETCKQCRRNELMIVESPVTVNELVRMDSVKRRIRLLAHPYGDVPELFDVLCRRDGTDVQQILMAVGPEGGFTDDEVFRLVSAGWQQVSLGPRILRVETAASALAAIALAVFNSSRASGGNIIE